MPGKGGEEGREEQGGQNDREGKREGEEVREGVMEGRQTVLVKEEAERERYGEGDLCLQGYVILNFLHAFVGELAHLVADLFLPLHELAKVLQQNRKEVVNVSVL